MAFESSTAQTRSSAVSRRFLLFMYTPSFQKTDSAGEKRLAEAAERRAEFEATEVTAQEAAEPAPVEEDVPHEYQMTVTLTRIQLRQFTQAMATLGIHGNLRRIY